MALNPLSPNEVLAPDEKLAFRFAPQSKFMAAIEYNPKDLTMDITFHSGSKIRYVRVYPNTFLSFKQSPTHDAYFARAIKGNLMSIKLINKNIGRKESTPLKQVKKEHNLDAGIKQTRIERIKGGVARAFAGAGLSPSGLS